MEVRGYLSKHDKKRPRNLYFPWPCGCFAYSIGCKKLIESPFSHGTNVPCCHNDLLTGEEIQNDHRVNIGDIPEAVKLFFPAASFSIKIQLPESHSPAYSAESSRSVLQGAQGRIRAGPDALRPSPAYAVYFRIGVIAYNLFLGFRRLACPETWGRHTIATFRWKLVQVAGRIVHHAGQVILKLAVEADLLSGHFYVGLSFFLKFIDHSCKPCYSLSRR